MHFIAWLTSIETGRSSLQSKFLNNNELFFTSWHIHIFFKSSRTNSLILSFSTSVPTRTLSLDVLFSRHLYEASWAKHFCQTVAQRSLCGPFLYLVRDFMQMKCLCIDAYCTLHPKLCKYAK